MTTVSATTPRADERISAKSLPFFLMHLAVLGAFFTGTRPIDWAVCIGLYYLRMFGITAGFHRYFAHRAYKTNRVFQFALAWIGTMSAQKGVLWWAGHHRHHHRFSDTDEDIHSPTKRGFWWSHVGWILSSRYDDTPFDDIKDFAKYPELRWLNTYHLVPPAILGVLVYLTMGASGLFIGFFLSTVLLWHGTFTINSLSHVFGSQRYVTGDTSRNNFWLALVTMGEGWHNNHHYYQSTANQGFYWWEVDMSYYVLKVLAAVGIVSHLRTPSERVLNSNRVGDRATERTPILEAVRLPEPGVTATVPALAATGVTNLPTHILTSPVSVRAELPPAA